MLNCLRQPGLIRYVTKSLCELINTALLSPSTGSNPAAGTKSIGLPAGALGLKVFAAQLRGFYLDKTTIPIYRDHQKP